MIDSKYQQYVFTQPKFTEPPPKVKAAPTFGIDEALISRIPQFEFNCHFVAVLAPHVSWDPPHKHTCDELLFFISCDPENTADLGGEVEIALGEEWEKHVITTSAVVCLPKGVNHAPIYIRKVDRPFYFGHVLLAGAYDSSNLENM